MAEINGFAPSEDSREHINSVWVSWSYYSIVGSDSIHVQIHGGIGKRGTYIIYAYISPEPQVQTSLNFPYVT